MSCSCPLHPLPSSLLPYYRIHKLKLTANCMGTDFGQFDSHLFFSFVLSFFNFWKRFLLCQQRGTVACKRGRQGGATTNTLPSCLLFFFFLPRVRLIWITIIKRGSTKKIKKERKKTKQTTVAAEAAAYQEWCERERDRKRDRERGQGEIKS